jgi:hypothetical protein
MPSSLFLVAELFKFNDLATNDLAVPSAVKSALSRGELQHEDESTQTTHYAKRIAASQLFA